MASKERTSLAIEPALLARLDALVARAGSNRSAVVCELIRDRLVDEEWASLAGDAVATVTLVYDHRKRELADRMLAVGHDHHAATLASLHVHLDHHSCLEVIALKGKAKELRHVAEHLVGLKGVKHGKVVVTHARP